MVEGDFPNDQTYNSDSCEEQVEEGDIDDDEFNKDASALNAS